MKRKIYSILFSFMFVFVSAVVLTACGTKDFDASKIVVDDSAFTYDGQAHIFVVDYDVEGVEATVTYSEKKDGDFVAMEELKFVNAGTYTAYYKLSAEGFNDYVSTEPVEFTIGKRGVNLTIQDYEWMLSEGEITEITPSYIIDGLVGGDNLGLTFNVGENRSTGEAYDKDNVSYGEKYEIAVSTTNPNYMVSSNDANVVIKDYVGVYDSTGNVLGYSSNLVDAYDLLTENATIKLHGDIKSKTGNYLGDITLKATSKNYKFKLDLNGYVVEAELDFINYNSPGNYTNYGIDVTIVDSSLTKTGRIGGTLNDYGVLVKGNGKVKVKLEGVLSQGEEGGIYSNGSCEGAVIIANNCSFFGVGSNVESGTIGAYLPGKYTYTFTNCYFEGETGYYAKSGTHTLSNCHIVGIRGEHRSEKYYGNGGEATGSALVVDSTIGYLQPMTVNVTNCEFDSVAGYCIEVFSTADNVDNEVSYATVSVSNAKFTTYGQEKPAYTEYADVVTGIDDAKLEKDYE